MSASLRRLGIVTVISFLAPLCFVAWSGAQEVSSDTVQIGVEVYGPDSPPPTATATVTPTTTVTPSPIKPTPSVTPVQTPPSNPIPTAVPGQTPTVVAVRALPNTGTEPGVDMAPAMILVLSAGLVMSMAALAVQSRKRRA